MKYLLLYILFIVAAGCGNSLSVASTWTNGNHKLKLTPDNNFTLYSNDTIKFSGIYAVVMDKMQFINRGNNLPDKCIRAGRYSFTIANDSLQLIMQDDPCTERKFMLNDVYWKREQ